MRRKFTANLVLLLLLNILVKPVWIFGIDRSVQNIVGAADYGLYYALFNLSLILNIVLDFGLTNYNNREISRHPNLLVKYLSNIVGLKFMLSVVYAVVTVAVAFFMGYTFKQMPLLLLLIVNQFLSSLILYLRSNLNALQFFKIDSLLSVLDKVLMIVLCGIVIWGRLGFISLSINVFVLAQTISYVLATLVAVVFVVYKGGRFWVRISRISAMAMLKQSYPYAILVLLMATYSRMDIIMVERLLPNGDQNAGIYAQAFRLVDAYNMFPFLVASLLLPIFSKMIKEQQPLNSFVGYSLKVMVIPVFAIAVPTFFFREPIMNLLYSNHTELSSEILGLLIGSFVFISINYVFGTLLTAQGAIKTMNKVSALAVCFGVALQVILIKRDGIVGAAVGNLCVNAMVAIVQAIICIKTLKLNFIPYTPKYLIFIVLSIFLVAVVRSLLPTLLMFLVCCGAIVFLAFLLRLVTIGDILLVVRNKE